MSNHLKHSTSPYLLQHANNPVNWYPWCEEAFARAKSENKPIFLSIGYSTCHRCHVMAHESFEDAIAAAASWKTRLPLSPEVTAVSAEQWHMILSRRERPLQSLITMKIGTQRRLPNESSSSAANVC